MEKTPNYTQAWISTITIGWLRAITNLMGCHPDHILTKGEKLWVNSFQLIPLRGMNIDNIQQSWLINNIVTLEAPRWGTVWRLLCGSQRKAQQTAREVLEINQSILSIDFIQGDAIEIAKCWVDLLDTQSWAIHHLNQRIIEPWKRMVFDNFHARDYQVGRDQAMKWAIPNKKITELWYQEIFDKQPLIVWVHIQERNPEQIEQFLNSDHSHLEFEIRLLKKHLWNTSQKIPVIIELDPLPLSPISRWLISNSTFSAIRHNDKTLQKFIEKVNILWYT